MAKRVTFDDMMEKFRMMSPEIEEATLLGLVRSATLVKNTAAKKFGDYQPAYGPFEAWAALATKTVDEKIRHGATSDDPLIGYYDEKGRKAYSIPLGKSIRTSIDRVMLSAQIGTNDPIGKYHEYGTSRIPPRPFLRPALYQNEEMIKKLLSDAIGIGLFEKLG